MQKLILWTTFIFLFVLGACTSTQKVEDIQLPASASSTVPISTSTEEVVDNLQSTPTYVIEIATPTVSVTPTITFVPYPNATPLAKLLLTTDDVVTPESQKMDFVLGIIDAFLKEDLYVKDKSYDLKQSCPIECTRQVWGTSHSYIEIQMFRAEDEMQASSKAEELFYGLKPYRLEYETDEYKLWINAPASNTHIGISDWNNGFVLATSRGNIAFMIVSYPSPYSDDALHEVSLMAAFANLQIDKLKKANIIP